MISKEAKRLYDIKYRELHKEHTKENSIYDIWEQIKETENRMESWIETAIIKPYKEKT